MRRGQRELDVPLRDGFELQEGRELDVDVRLAAARLVDVLHLAGVKDADGDVLRYRRFTAQALFV